MTKKDYLSARVPAELRDAFWATVPSGYKRQHVMTTAAELWVNLPAEVREALLRKETDATALVSLVRQIVDERIAAGRDTAAARPEKQDTEDSR